MATEEKGDDSVSMKPGRNEPCFCGSGLKLKKCHGRLEGRGRSDEGRGKKKWSGG
jgi:hypothetical protein